MAHESGYALVVPGVGIPQHRQDALAKHKASRAGWFRVSEYAGSDRDGDELFAEVTAFMAAGCDNMVPANVRAAHIETFKNYRRR